MEWGIIITANKSCPPYLRYVAVLCAGQFLLIFGRFDLCMVDIFAVGSEDDVNC